MSGDSIERRVYAVRLALGDGYRTAMSMEAFAELLDGKADTRYDSSVISRIENGDRKLSLADVAAIASVDPLKRGKLWLAWGEEIDATMADRPIATGIPVNDATIETLRRGRAAKADASAKKVGGQRRRARPQD